MAGTFLLEVVTPERLVFSGEVTSVQAPALDGLFGVLHNRAPLLSALSPGTVSFHVPTDNETHHLAITGGFFQVAANKAVLLAEQAEFGHEIDPVEAQRRYDAAKQELMAVALTDEESQKRHHLHATAAARVRAADRYRR